MINAFTIDVEEHFQVTAFADIVGMASWSDHESRVVRNTRVLLESLSKRGTRGTFFILGWIAKHHPQLIREIAGAGHEIASHGMNHQLIYNQSPEKFREETRSAKHLLEDLCQIPVIGYRAATYSITRRSLWALDILAEEGFLYDSSIFPMRHDRYGIPDAKLVPHLMETTKGHRLIEFPISVLRHKGLTLPVAGGGYFRIFPYSVTRWGLKKLNASGQEFVFYIHPWEIDPAQPRIADASLLSRFRHYCNLDRCHARLESLLNDFAFAPMQTILEGKDLLIRDAGQFRINAGLPYAKVS